MARRSLLRASALAIALLAPTAEAFGPAGHEIAGALAERALCATARRQVATIGGGPTLADLGLWADRIRSEPKWRHTAPWHYMNVRDAGTTPGSAAATLRSFAHPPEGDVLWAIERFSAVLADRGAPAAARRDALRFVVHFVVDVHQPLHVGRAEDRGGNLVDVRYGSTTVNLHRFWDTDVIALEGLSLSQFVRRLAASDEWRSPALAAARADLDPIDWAAESLELRSTVYSFAKPVRAGPATLNDEYVAVAERTTERRLTLAAARLAGLLNRLFCAQ